MVEIKRLTKTGEGIWVKVDSSDSQSISELKQQYQLTDEMLVYALDKNERARAEYDEQEGALLLVFNIPHQQKIENHYKSSPMTFILKKDHLFTFFSPNTAYIVPIMERLLKQYPEQTPLQFLLQSLFLISGTFFPLAEELNDERGQLNKKLRERTTNKNLLALSDLEIGLVYLVTATKQNAILLEQIKALNVYRQMTDSDKEQLDDVLIEAKQAAEMIKLSSQVVDQLSGTYNNLLNNNLNDTMKFLTVWSLLLTVPTIVTGFFGMNVPLPFSDSVFGWGIAMLISIGLSIWMLIAMWRKIR